MSYIFAADVWCDACGRAIRAELDASGKAPEDAGDEYTYDSDDYPKQASDDEATDNPTHCGAHSQCLNRIDLADWASKTGAKLIAKLSEHIRYVGEPIGGLTSEGADNLRELMLHNTRGRKEQSPAIRARQRALNSLWLATFGDSL